MLESLGDINNYEINGSTDKINPLNNSPKGGGSKIKPFLKGPISLNWLTTALTLPGKTINVGLALLFFSGIFKRRTIKLTNRMCKKFNILSRSTKLKALRNLEAAGLIKVEWYTRTAPKVTILNIENPNERSG